MLIAAFIIPSSVLLLFFYASWRVTRHVAVKHVEMMEVLCVAIKNQTEILKRISEQNNLKELRYNDNVVRLEAILAKLETVCKHETVVQLETKV